MDDRKNSEVFHFTYSAKEQEELKAIRQKYLPAQEDKMQKLRKLDAHATNKGRTISLIMGVLGVLIMGGGMSLSLVWQGSLFIPGIILGVFGMAVAGMAYLVYQRILRKEREKIAPEVLRLTEELMK